MRKDERTGEDKTEVGQKKREAAKRKRGRAREREGQVRGGKQEGEEDGEIHAAEEEEGGRLLQGEGRDLGSSCFLHLPLVHQSEWSKSGKLPQTPHHHHQLHKKASWSTSGPKFRTPP